MGPALTKLSVEEVAENVKGIGAAYHQYVEAIINNGIDGRTLSLIQEEEIADCFRAIGVVNKLHWIKLKLRFQDIAQGRDSNGAFINTISSLVESSTDSAAAHSVMRDANSAEQGQVDSAFCIAIPTGGEAMDYTSSDDSKGGLKINKRGKFRLSCNRCTIYKKKCVGKPKCNNCAKHDKVCVFNERLRPGPSTGSGAQTRVVTKTKSSSISMSSLLASSVDSATVLHMSESQSSLITSNSGYTDSDSDTSAMDTAQPLNSN